MTDNTSLRIAGDPGAPERVLHAQNVEIGMAPDGTTLTSLTARDQVVLDLPGTKEEPSKSVRSTSLVASGEAGKGLTAATFSEGVEYVETGGTPPTKRTVTSRSLDTTLNGGLGEIREAEFKGSVRLRQGEGATAANADIMRYQVQTGQVELTSAPGGEIPRVVNDQIAVDAARVDMTIEGSKMKATGEKAPVRTVMYPAKPGTKDARRTPGIMQQDRPVNGSSRELVYTGGESSTAEFTGAVRLWQGEKAETVIQGEKITVDSKTGNLTAQGSVLSTMIVQDTNPTTKLREATRSTGQAQQMVYDDAARKITYTTKARLVGSHGDLTAETIVLTLGANSQDVERLDATETVTLKETDRVTIGDRLTYVASTVRVQHGREGTARAHAPHDRRRLPVERRPSSHLFQSDRYAAHSKAKKRPAHRPAAIRPARRQKAEWRRSARKTSRSLTAAARLCAASASRCSRARWSACSVRTARAKRRRST